MIEEAGLQSRPMTETSPASLWPKVIRVAWLSVGLGLALEILLLILAALSNSGGDSPKPFIADVVQKVSWSFIVCIGLALGTTASKSRPAAMGFLGLISAPLGFAIARALHKGVGQAIGMAASTGGGASPYVLAVLKAVEYGVLGAVLGWLTRRAGGASLGLHAGTGAAVGIVFGGAIIAVLVQAAAGPPSAVDLTAKGINEVLFPIGCSLVLYATGALGKRLGG
jgi:FtsH-binding integral membrane protein